MPWNITATQAQAGDLVQLVGLRHKHFIFTLSPGAEFGTHRGVVKHDDLIGLPWGSQVFSHLGAPFFLLQPSLADILIDLPRSTQILYPKDIGFILVTMGIGHGQRVMEAGSGSGAMTTALAFNIGPTGRVYSYDQREDFQNLAQKNLARFGLSERVEFKIRDIASGFDETDMDAFFLDVPNSHNFISQVRAALKPGGFFCSLIPTFNQVERTIFALRRNQFAFIEMVEIIQRYYKPEPLRIRPVDRMVAHTGFLLFARRVELGSDPRAMELLREQKLVDAPLDENADDEPVSQDE